MAYRIGNDTFYFGVPDPLPDLGPEYRLTADPEDFLTATDLDSGRTYYVCFIKDDAGRPLENTWLLREYRLATEDDVARSVASGAARPLRKGQPHLCGEEVRVTREVS